MKFLVFVGIIVTIVLAKNYFDIDWWQTTQSLYFAGFAIVGIGVAKGGAASMRVMPRENRMFASMHPMLFSLSMVAMYLVTFTILGMFWFLMAPMHFRRASSSIEDIANERQGRKK